MTVSQKKNPLVVTVLELLGKDVKEGQKAKVITDNGLYGTTVIRKSNTLVNNLTGVPITLTTDLLQTQFKLIEGEKKATVDEMIKAYGEGKEVKVYLGDSHRIIKKDPQDEFLETLMNMAKDLPFHPVSENSVVTMKELAEGRFYITE